ncbi:unnamed protein product, partial [Gulo gulo]
MQRTQKSKAQHWFHTSFSKNGGEVKWSLSPQKGQASIRFPSSPRSEPQISHPAAWPNVPRASPLPSAHPTLAQGRPRVPTLYRAAAWAFVRSAVRSSS